VVSVLVELGVVDDLLDQSRDVREPSFEARSDCGRELVQRLVLIGEAWLWLSSDDRGLGFGGLVCEVDVDLLEVGRT
jgi:hypothetical protein